MRRWMLLEHPPFLGVCFLLSWILLLFYSSIPGAAASSPVDFMSATYLSSTVVMSITVIVGAFFLGSKRRLLHSRPVIISASVAMSIGTMLCLLSSVNDNSVAGYAGGIITGIASGIVTLQWTGTYRTIGSLSALMSIPVVILASVGVSRTILYLPANAMYLLTCILPLASCICCCLAASETEGVDEGAGVTDASQARAYASLFVFTAFFGFTNGVVDFSMGQYGYSSVFYILVTVVTAIAVAYFMFKYGREQLFLYFVAPYLLLVMLLAPVLALNSANANAEIAAVGELVVEALLFLMAIAFANYYSVRSIASYALSRIGLAAGSAIGWSSAGMLPQLFSGSFGSTITFMLTIMGVLAVAVYLLLVINNYSKSASNDANVDLTETVVAVAPHVAKSIEERCDELAARHGVSPRELDVMRLLARGYTSPRIQSELFIAPGTVNYHSRNIYAKLGVHSKQELIALVSTSED